MPEVPLSELFKWDTQMQTGMTWAACTMPWQGAGELVARPR